MTVDKARLTALITPVEREAQDEAVTLAGEGRTTKATRRLRKDSALGLIEAPVALSLLTEGHTLPTNYGEALDNLQRLDAPLVSEMTSLLDSGQQDAAIKLLREQTDIDLAGGYHLTMELSSRRDGS